jgi:hypothetical protein
MTLDEAVQRLQSWKRKTTNATEQKLAVERYGKIFHPDRLDQLTKDEFKGFLLAKNNKHWRHIQRNSGTITQDMGKLKCTLKILLDESRPLKGRLDALFGKTGASRIKGLGRAVVTPILMVVYPDKYGVYNTKSEAGLDKLGKLPHFKSSDPFSTRYVAVNAAILDIAQSTHLPLYLIDTMFALIVS